MPHFDKDGNDTYLCQRCGNVFSITSPPVWRTDIQGGRRGNVCPPCNGAMGPAITGSLVEHFSACSAKIVIPPRPPVPARHDFPTEADHNKALDYYEQVTTPAAILAGSKKVAEKKQLDLRFKAAVLRELGLRDHPKADLLWKLAQDNGQGYEGIYNWATKLVPLLT